MEILLTRYHWLQLTGEERQLMRETFNIPKSGGVEMLGNKIMSDGSNENDLKAVNIESMQNFLQCKSDTDTFESLYNATIVKVQGMIAEQKVNQESVNLGSGNKSLSESEMLDSVLVTITKLSVDSQFKVKSFINTILGMESSVVINTNVVETPNVTIKKAGRPKKVKEGSNE